MSAERAFLAMIRRLILFSWQMDFIRYYFFESYFEYRNFLPTQAWLERPLLTQRFCRGDVPPPFLCRVNTLLECCLLLSNAKYSSPRILSIQNLNCAFLLPMILNVSYFPEWFLGGSSTYNSAWMEAKYSLN